MVSVKHWPELAMDLHVFPIPIPPLTSLSTRSLGVFPVHQARTLVSCIQPGLVICFTLDNIHVSMLFSWNIPPSPSPTYHFEINICKEKNLLKRVIMLSVFRGAEKRVQIYDISGKWFNLLKPNLKILIRSLKSIHILWQRNSDSRNFY